MKMHIIKIIKKRLYHGKFMKSLFILLIFNIFLCQAMFEKEKQHKQKIRDKVAQLCCAPDIKSEDLNQPIKYKSFGHSTNRFPLHEIVAYNADDDSLALIKLLLKKGADPNLKLFDSAYVGHHYPVFLEECFHQYYIYPKKYFRVMCLALYHGADPYLKYDRESSPIVQARQTAHPEICEMLERAPKELIDILTSILSRGTMHLQQAGSQEQISLRLPVDVARLIAERRYKYCEPKAYQIARLKYNKIENNGYRLKEKLKITLLEQLFNHHARRNYQSYDRSQALSWLDKLEKKK